MTIVRAERDAAAGLASASAGASPEYALSASACEDLFDDRYVLWYVEDGGGTVGMCAGRVEGTMFQIRAVHIDAERRDALWASAVEDMMSYGRRNGDRIAYANVDAADSDTLARYGGMGFREVSRRERDVGGRVATEAELTRII